LESDQKLTVKGHVQDSRKLEITIHLADGKIGEHEFNVNQSLGHDIYVQICDQKIAYLLKDLVNDAYKIAIKKNKKKE